MQKASQILETLTESILNKSMENINNEEIKLCVRCGKDVVSEQKLCFSCLEKYYKLVPKRFLKCGFSNFIVNDKNKEALEKSKEFLENNKGLYIYGSVGCGKTHLAVAVFKKLFLNKKDVKFITMSELLLEIRDSFKKNWSEDEIISVYSDCEYLILDDFGTQKQSEFNIEAIYLLFDRRYRNNLDKIFITSNLSVGDIAIICGDRIASRILSMCDVAKIEDVDRRLEKCSEDMFKINFNVSNQKK